MSKLIICNCNSYGNIDYGKPVLFKTSDFRTSTGIGTKHMPPRQHEYFGVKPDISKTAATKLIEPVQAHYGTQYSNAYGKPKHIRFEYKPNNAMLCKNVHAMRILKEKMFKNPPPPRSFPLSEHHSQYFRKESAPYDGPEPTILSQSSCPLSSQGKTEQPRLRVESTGILKQLDPYVTTSHMAYVPFTKDQLYMSQKPIINFYAAKKSEELKNSTIKKPLNDETKFKKTIRNLLIPKMIHRVPFKGKTSEYKGSYVPPTTSCYWNHMFDSGVDYPESLSGPSAWQTLAPPNMYCTESCHIGTGFPVCAAVKSTKDDKTHVYTHKICDVN